MKIYDRLAFIRNHFKESQQRFAERLGITQSTYAKYEKGDRGIPDELKLKLIQIGINSHWLLTGEGSMFLSPSADAGEDSPPPPEANPNLGKKNTRELLKDWIDSLDDEEAEATAKILWSLSVLQNPGRLKEKE